jgi:beta-glucosidase
VETIATPTDHCGLNYYFRQGVTDDPAARCRTRMVAVPPARQTVMGWEVHPDRLTELLLRRLADEYQVPCSYVTENGSAWPDVVLPDGLVEDRDRTAYREPYIAAGWARRPGDQAAVWLWCGGRRRLGVVVAQRYVPRWRDVGRGTDPGRWLGGQRAGR